MNLKVILFFSIIILILSAGAVSSADVDNINVTDSSIISDESLDVDFESPILPSNGDNGVIEDESGNAVESAKGEISLDTSSYDENDNQMGVEKDTVEKVPTRIFVNDINANWNDDKHLLIALKDIYGNHLVGMPISVDLNGEVNYTVKTNGKVKVPTNELYPGTYDAKIRFAGNDKYEASSATATVVINYDMVCQAHDLNGLKSHIADMGTKIPEEKPNIMHLLYDINTIDEKLIITIDKGMDIIIDGHGHTIDLKGSSKHDHYFVVKSGNVIFKNVNFINGYNKDGDKGGAISFENSATGTIINCTFKNCWAENHGGAIADRTEHKLTVINSTFIGNKASEDDGGAIFCKGLLYLEGCLFESNNAKVKGGAVFCEKDVEVIGSIFKSNKASGAKAHQCYGGAISTNKNVYIDNCTFENNTSEDYAGAVHGTNIHINQNQSNTQAFNTFFRNNKAGDNNGGALYSENDTYAKNALFSGNNAYEDGGAIFSKNDVITHNCLFEYNKAKGAKICDCYGGAIRAITTACAYNSTFNNNTAKYGGAIVAYIVKQSNSFFNDNENKYGHDGGIYLYK